MSVRLSPAGLERRSLSASAAVTATTTVPAARSRTPPRIAEDSPEPGGYATFAARQAQCNEEATAAQRALVWLDALDAGLRGLGRRLRMEPGAVDVSPGSVDQALVALRDVWLRRHAATGGTLDAALAWYPAGDARQRFRLRGLDAAALIAAEAETVVFHPRGLGRPSRTWLLLADEAAAVRRQRLAAVLAGAGIDVHEVGGEPVLSIREAAWPSLRDTMRIHGDGKRFPAGWPSPATLEPLAGPIACEQWNVDTGAERRQLCCRLGEVLARVEHRRARLAARLDDGLHALRTGTAVADPALMFQAAHDFARLLDGPARFPRLATAGACLRGISRRKAGAVLGHGAAYRPMAAGCVPRCPGPAG